MEHEPDQLKRCRGAFSLVELLTVVAIMAVLTVLTGPPLAQALRGGRLSLSTDTVEVCWSRRGSLHSPDRDLSR